MPYFEKGSLANLIKSGQSLDREFIIDIGEQVAEGLVFAHRSGIIHRDLKPANILLSNDDKACLADFGLARSLFNDTLIDVESRNQEGTATYMSPAVARGDAEDTRCDIYSFGAILYEMLTGCPPYQGQGTKDILNQIAAGPPRPIASLNPKADNKLIMLAEGCMARELRDRYADMRDVLIDLQRIKENKQLARHNSLKEKVSSGLAHAYQFLKIVFALVGFALVSIIIWSIWTKKETALPETAPLSNQAKVNSTFFEAVEQPIPLPQTPDKVKPKIIEPVQQSKPPSPIPEKVAVEPEYRILPLAGQAGVSGYADGMKNQAQFNFPKGIAVDRVKNIYVADTANKIIRKVDPNGVVTTLAGVSGVAGSANGVGSDSRFGAPQFYEPTGIAADNSGNVYVADAANNTIRKIDSKGVATTFAGHAGNPGSQDGTGIDAGFFKPTGVAVDNVGNLIVADMGNHCIRKITPAAEVTTIAGHPRISGSADGLGSQARFNCPSDVAVDLAGNVYVTDTGNNTIRKLSPDGIVSTIAGMPGDEGSSDGVGKNVRFKNPRSLAIDGSGNIFVADTGNLRVMISES